MSGKSKGLILIQRVIIWALYFFSGFILYSKKGIIIAFATRYPTNRIALFYFKGKFQRKGYGSNLLHKLEDEAKKEGLDSLYTVSYTHLTLPTMRTV